MRCVSPLVRRYLDVMGFEHTQECPCGKCIACLHNYQDSWSIRMSETSKAYRSFVYDTLTFSPSALTYWDYTDDIQLSEFSSFSKELKSLFDKYIEVDKSTGEARLLVPVVDRSVIRNWIKRGRENFYLFHHYRPKIKYFIVEEYGPATSRPHMHLLMWGLTREDYVRFFAKPWRRDYGFTRTKYIDGGSDKDRDCITRYISKYVSKGVFESPFVRYGFVPKPFRCISHGIGEEYLRKPEFNFFRSDKADFYRSICVGPGKSGDLSRVGYLRFLYSSGFLDDVSFPFEKCGWALTTYYDKLGGVHALPRYYKHKLANYHKPNLLSYALQTYLLESARVLYNKNLQKFADSLGYFFAFKEDPKDAFAGLGRSLYNLLSLRLAVEQRLSSYVTASGCYTKLKNHYGRALNLFAPLAV